MLSLVTAVSCVQWPIQRGWGRPPRIGLRIFFSIRHLFPVQKTWHMAIGLLVCTCDKWRRGCLPPPFQNFWIRHWSCDVAKMLLLCHSFR